MQRISVYVKTWQKRCYRSGIPDEVPHKLASAGRAPSWKAVAMAILRNDHHLHSLGFQMRETAGSLSLVEARKKAEVGAAQMNLDL